MKNVIYRLRAGSAEHRVSKDRFARMQERNPRAFVFVREEDVKEVRTPSPASPGTVVQVPPAPLKRGRKPKDEQPQDQATQEGPREPKRVRKGPKSEGVDPANNDEPAAQSGE